MFPHVSPTIKIISHRGHAAFGLHVVSIFHLAFFFKVQCINEFPKSVSRRSLFSFFLRALHFTRHGLQCIWLILALCNIPMAISTVSRLASPAVAEDCALVSKKSPISHYSMLDCVVSSRREPPTLEVGGCGSNDVTLEQLQPVLDIGISGVTGCAKVLPPSLVPPLTLICRSGLLFPNKATGLYNLQWTKFRRTHMCTTKPVMMVHFFFNWDWYAIRMINK